MGWEEARDYCEDNGYRLCTLQEMLSDVTQGDGCYYDLAYNWVSDGCDPAQADSTHNGLANARQQSDPLVAEDEDGSNDSAGNGLTDLSTSLIGTAIVVVAVVAVVLGIVSAAKRRKRARAEEETQIAVELGMDKAAVDSAESVTAEAVTAEMPSENGTAAAATEGDVAAEVAVGVVAPKVDDAVSVQQEE